MQILLGAASPELSQLVHSSLQRFAYAIEDVDNGVDVFQHVLTKKYGLLILDYHMARMNTVEILQRFMALKNFQMPPVICLASNEYQRHEIENLKCPRAEVLSKPIVAREFVGKLRQILHQENRAVCLGGGTGLFTLLSGLKTLSNIRLTSIVSMSDDGGSTGRLKHMFGILPPGDVRRSLVALSTAPDLVNEMMQYRFSGSGDLAGHNLGNLMLTALTEMRGSMARAVRSLSEILSIQGEVIPVTEHVHTLYAELENGEVLHGETAIDVFESGDPSMRIKRLWQEPEVSAHPDTLETLRGASVIILGPGDLFTSIISNLIVRGIAEAIRTSKARKIYICNIMTEPGETNHFQVSDHVREVNKYLGADCLDDVICSSTEFSEAALKNYSLKKQQPVAEKDKSLLSAVTRAAIHWKDVASEDELVRHDALKLAGAIREILDLKR